MKKLLCLLTGCCLLAGCDSSDQSILTAPVVLNQKPLVIVPKRALSAPFHISVLIVAVPSGYQLDEPLLRDPKGEKVVIQATLTSTHGQKHLLKQEGILQGGYVVLVPDPPISPGSRFKEISIYSSAPLRTSEIRWLSTDKF